MTMIAGDGAPNAGRVTVRASQSGLRAARRHIRALAGELNFNATQSLDLQVAAGEALSNAFRHGSPDSRNGRILISWQYADNVLTIAVTDQGAGIAPRKVTLYGEAGGHGIRIMNACADEVSFHFGLGSTVVLRKRA